MGYRVIGGGRRPGIVSTPRAAVLSALRRIPAPTKIVEGRVWYQVRSSWRVSGTIETVFWMLSHCPIDGVRIVDQQTELLEAIDVIGDRTMIRLEEAIARGSSVGLRIAITEALFVLGASRKVLDEMIRRHDAQNELPAADFSATGARSNQGFL